MYLVPELVAMTGLTDEQRRDFRLMRDVAYYTKLEPPDRNREVMWLQSQLSKSLPEFSLKLSNDQRVPGFQLDPPAI
jgi:aubergine-like protein